MRKVKGMLLISTGIATLMVTTLFVMSAALAQHPFSYLSEDEVNRAINHSERHTANAIQGIDVGREIEEFKRKLKCTKILLAAGDSWFDYPGLD